MELRNDTSSLYIAGKGWLLQEHIYALVVGSIDRVANIQLQQHKHVYS